MGNRRYGFTLIEMAMVMVIFGIMATVLIPPLVSSVKYEKRAENKDALNAVKLGVIGYAKAKEKLPAELADANLATVDVWGRDYKYLVADNLTEDDSICVASSTNATVENSAGEQGDIAFAVASRGRNIGSDIDGNYSGNQYWKVSNAGDDLVEFVTLSQLKYIICKDFNDEDEDIIDDNSSSSYDSYEYILSSPSGFSIGWSTDVFGNVYSGEDITIESSNSDVDGDIVALGNVTLKNSATVSGSVFSGGVVTLSSSNSYVGNGINASSNVILKSSTKVDGDVRSGGNVELKSSGSIVNGDIHASGDVTLGSGSVVNGNVRAGGNVILKASSAVINGNIDAFGYILLESGTSVNGYVHTKGPVTLKSSFSEINGSVEIDGDLNLSWDVSVNGSVNLSGSVKNFEQADYVGHINKVDDSTELAELIDPEYPEGVNAVQNPPLQTFFAGTDKEIYSTNMDLSPGIYGDIIIENNGSKTTMVTLSSGDYYFKSLVFKTGTKINLDLESNGDINIFVEDDVNLGSNYQFLVSGKSISSVEKEKASRVYLETHGKFTLPSNSDWFGTVLSKETLSVGSGFTVVGILVSLEELSLSGGGSYTYVPSTFSTNNW